MAVPRVGAWHLIGMLASASWLSLLLARASIRPGYTLVVASPDIFGGITEI